MWHPFSLSSASLDTTVQLLVGIQGGAWNKTDWTQPEASQTWSYKLYRTFLATATQSGLLRSRKSLKAKIRGPYGSPFSKCFQASYPAVVVIGAGTGLTSALSVLKEMIYRHMSNQSRQRVWFVWSCSRVDDLIMVIRRSFAALISQPGSSSQLAWSTYCFPTIVLADAA